MDCWYVVAAACFLGGRTLEVDEERKDRSLALLGKVEEYLLIAVDRGSDELAVDCNMSIVDLARALLSLCRDPEISAAMAVLILEGVSEADEPMEGPRWLQ